MTLRVFTRDISSWVETRPGIKSSLSMAKCLLLFTRFCRNEVSFRDELIPVKKAAINFHSGMNKRKKRRYKHFIPGWNFTMSMFLLNFWRMYSMCFPTLRLERSVFLKKFWFFFSFFFFFFVWYSYSFGKDRGKYAIFTSNYNTCGIISKMNEQRLLILIMLVIW